MSANTYGRQVVVPLTNKSGGSVAAGDVVVMDSSTNEAFTTTTTLSTTSTVGIAQETIANNAVGRVLLSGYAALINVNASVTRLNYGATYSVAKQATDVGARAPGTFVQFLKSGTTPSGMVYATDLGGTALTNPMSAIGDIIQGTTAGAPARLAAPLAGKVLTGAGVTTPLVYAYPPGYELAYAQITAAVNPTATSEATANSVVDAGSVTYDGTAVLVTFYAPDVTAPFDAAGRVLGLALYDGASSVGIIAQIVGPTATANRWPITVQYRLTPSAGAHTYSIRGWISAGTGVAIRCGAGGSGAAVPAFIRITKV